MSVQLERIFRQAADGRDEITSDAEWRSFMHRLAHHGLLGQASEEELLERLWAEASAGQHAFGQHRPAALHISQLRAMLVREFATPLDGQIDGALTQLSLQTESLAALCQSWDLDGMDEIATRQLLTLTEDLTTAHARHRRAAEQYRRRQEHLLKHQAMLSLFWDRVPRSAEASLARTALQFQQDNLALIERRVQSRRLRHFRFAASRDPKQRGRVLPDRFGHGGVGGGQCFLAYAVGDEHKPVEVVAVPFAGLAYAKLAAVRHCFDAHREMALSSYLPHCLGLDDMSSPGEQLYFYEHINARPLSSLLDRVALDETQPLFRYWARETLCALTDLAEQCAHRVAHHIGPEHIMISAEGTGVSLGNVRFGPPLVPSDPDALARHIALEERLAGDFADILEAIRASEAGGGGGGSAAGARARAGRVTDVDEPLCAAGGLHVRCGAKFSLRLAARAPQGALWHPPEIVSADEDGGSYHVAGEAAVAVTPVGMRGDKPEGPAPAATFVAEYTAREQGRFQLRFFCYRPWDGKPSEPALVLPVEVHDPGGSPVIEAVIRVCRPAPAASDSSDEDEDGDDSDGDSDEGGGGGGDDDDDEAERRRRQRREQRRTGRKPSQHRVPRLREVLSHPYFAAPTTEEIEAAACNFDELFRGVELGGQ